MSVVHNPLEPGGLGSAPCFYFTELCNLIKIAKIYEAPDF